MAGGRWMKIHMAVSLLLWCIKTIGSRRWFPSISWKFRWSRNGRKVDEIEHRGHQIEDFDSKIHIPRSKYSRKAEKKIENGHQFFPKFWWQFSFFFGFPAIFRPQNVNLRFEIFNLVPSMLNFVQFSTISWPSKFPRFSITMLRTFGIIMLRTFSIIMLRTWVF